MKEKVYVIGLRHKTKDEIQAALVKAINFNECVKKVNRTIRREFKNEYLIKTITEL